jgi:hypothetical protein
VKDTILKRLDNNMAQLIKPAATKIITKDGECEISISIELNINLNSAGIATVEAQAKAIETKVEEKAPESDEWVMPDFSMLKKVQFGKDT